MYKNVTVRTWQQIPVHIELHCDCGGIFYLNESVDSEPSTTDKIEYRHKCGDCLLEILLNEPYPKNDIITTGNEIINARTVQAPQYIPESGKQSPDEFIKHLDDLEKLYEPHQDIETKVHDED